MDSITTIFYIVILLFSVIIHELAHGYTADYLGDPTPRLQGRLTLNPIPHLDMFGSIILPALLVLSGTGFVVGWAKPIQYNPFNIRNRKWGAILIALAGPLSNIFLATVFGLVLRFFGVGLPVAVVTIFAIIVLLNIILALFNLIPIPPLDGHHILFSLLPDSGIGGTIKDFLSRYSFVLMLVVIFFVWRLLFPIVLWLFALLTGSTGFL
ncbi:MAG: site-2 protease family protein [Candidatus Pacebacteria bacterium]|nr:site-2 protease family protein [Candidatus Paceibacterota bacterium]